MIFVKNARYIRVGQEKSDVLLLYSFVEKGIGIFYGLFNWRRYWYFGNENSSV